MREVLKADGSQVSYRYDGAGNRVAKIIHRSDSTLTTHYVRDASGHVLAIYQDSLLAEQPIYGSSRLGMYRGGRTTGERILGQKNYELSNHLGNVLAVITDNVNMDQDSVWATVTSLQGYYSFGLEIESRSWSNENYRHDFNGKETDVETGWQDYGMRSYMKKYGRFVAVDKLTEKYPDISPFTFALNTPLQAKDADGNIVIFINGQHGGSGGNRSYWEGFDTKVMKQIGDFSARYYDGASGGWLNTAKYAALGGIIGGGIGTAITVFTKSNVNAKTRIATGAGSRHY